MEAKELRADTGKGPGEVFDIGKKAFRCIKAIGFLEYFFSSSGRGGKLGRGEERTQGLHLEMV